MIEPGFIYDEGTMIPYFKGASQDISLNCNINPSQPVCLFKPISVEQWVYRDPVVRRSLHTTVNDIGYVQAAVVNGVVDFSTLCKVDGVEHPLAVILRTPPVVKQLHATMGEMLRDAISTCPIDMRWDKAVRTAPLIPDSPLRLTMGYRVIPTQTGCIVQMDSEHPTYRFGLSVLGRCDQKTISRTERDELFRMWEDEINKEIK